MSRPFSVLRSCFVAICVYTAAKLNKMHAFSNATVRWLDGIPAKLCIVCVCTYGKIQNETKEKARKNKTNIKIKTNKNTHYLVYTYEEIIYF